VIFSGFRETAFAYAVSSAGVVISVARACSQGTLRNCGCDTHKYKMRGTRAQNSAWKWVGCSHNLRYGIKFSKMFLDARENGDDIHSEINLHNNNVGRMVNNKPVFSGFEQCKTSNKNTTKIEIV
jgi:hypothetical protein